MWAGATVCKPKAWMKRPVPTASGSSARRVSILSRQFAFPPNASANPAQTITNGSSQATPRTWSSAVIAKRSGATARTSQHSRLHVKVSSTPDRSPYLPSGKGVSQAQSNRGGRKGSSPLWPSVPVNSATAHVPNGIAAQRTYGSVRGAISNDRPYRNPSRV
jgi:hypothetical protein